MDYRKSIKNFILVTALLLACCCGITYIADPFFHYHKPWMGLKAVLNEKEYQCIGTLRNFEYDSVIVGSSVCENYNNAWFDEAYDCKAIKAIRSYGATADLCYFMNEAYEHQNLKYIFYNIDPGSLAQTPSLSFESSGCPMYLYDKNPFNDLKYLLNKDVLMERIPYMVAKSFTGDYDEGESYNWGQWKEFSEDMIIGLYIRKHSIEPMRDEKYYEKECIENIELIESFVKEHPETDFVFFIPPYSMVWWDNIYRNGDTYAYLYNMKLTVSRLTQYDNVHMYYFLNDEQITTNLDNYMDVLHFSPEINKYMVEEMAYTQREINQSNIDEIIDASSEFADRVINELIIPYEDQIKVAYYDE